MNLDGNIGSKYAPIYSDVLKIKRKLLDQQAFFKDVLQLLVGSKWSQENRS